MIRLTLLNGLRCYVNPSHVTTVIEKRAEKDGGRQSRSTVYIAGQEKAWTVCGHASDVAKAVNAELPENDNEIVVRAIEAIHTLESTASEIIAVLDESHRNGSVHPHAR